MKCFDIECNWRNTSDWHTQIQVMQLGTQGDSQKDEDDKHTHRFLTNKYISFCFSCCPLSPSIYMIVISWFTFLIKSPWSWSITRLIWAGGALDKSQQKGTRSWGDESVYCSPCRGSRAWRWLGYNYLHCRSWNGLHSERERSSTLVADSRTTSATILSMSANHWWATR